jgi:hypothetical protein
VAAGRLAQVEHEAGGIGAREHAVAEHLEPEVVAEPVPDADLHRQPVLGPGQLECQSGGGQLQVVGMDQLEGGPADGSRRSSTAVTVEFTSVRRPSLSRRR